MSALVLQAPGKISIENVPVPVPGPGEVLIKVRAATTCGTDLKAYLRGHPQIPMPGNFGHEYSGEVVALGAGAKFAVGQAVMGVHSAPCQQCFYCQKGQENLCETIMATKVLGSYAEYLLIPERIASLNVFEKPAGLTFEQASLLEPLACVAQGILELRPQPGDSVLVIGPGAIGLMFVAALRQRGISNITLAGRNAERLQVGKQFGATIAQYETYQPSDPVKHDFVIECTGQVSVWEKSVDFARRGGTVMLFGGCASGTRASFDTGRLHYDQITLLSPFHFGTEAVRLAFSWLVTPGFNLSSLISGTRTLGQAEETFADLQASRGLKYVFKP